MATTRAIRRYRPEPIPDDDLSQILWHATRAPSGSNRQPFRFVVLRDGPRARRAKAVLGEGFRAAWDTKEAADGYAAGSGAVADSPKARMAATMRHFVDHLEDVPVVVLACYGRHRAQNPTEGASVYPACQNLLLAARSLGYGGVMTMWHTLVEPDLREAVGLPVDIAIGATICLGRPEGNHGPVRRRPVQELVFDDRWDAPAQWATDPPGTRFTSAGPPRPST
ncbi:MAG TPA: nitroreductase family protein [Iamia sp.]|nr:nitroreductase family protein [Iamia sp.]